MSAHLQAENLNSIPAETEEKKKENSKNSI